MGSVAERCQTAATAAALAASVWSCLALLVTDIGGPLTVAFEQARNRITGRLARVEDEEYVGEPVAGHWSLGQDPAGRWSIDGGAAPMTTLSWRVGHLAGVALGGCANLLCGGRPSAAANIAWRVGHLAGMALGGFADRLSAAGP